MAAKKKAAKKGGQEEEVSAPGLGGVDPFTPPVFLSRLERGDSQVKTKKAAKKAAPKKKK